MEEITMRGMIERMLLQALLLCACCALAGGLFFEMLISTAVRAQTVREATATARLRTLTWALIAAFLTTAFAFVAAPGGTKGMIVVWVRVVLLLGLLALLRRRVVGLGAVLLAVLLLGTQSALSRSAGAGIAPLLGDWLHLTLAAFWLGGVALLGVMAAAAARTPDVDVIRSFGVVVDRFSPFAFFCVAGLALGGIAQSAQFLGSFEALWMTEYGRALVVKLVLFGVLIGFGALHQQVLAPRLRRWALRKGAADGAALARSFRVSLLAEASCGVLLLFAVGVMKALTP